MTSTQDLVEHLKLKSLDATTFEGYSVPVGSPNVFGGQVLAQAIAAAYNTITNNRVLNSMHSYFLEAGDLNKPITFKVDVMRDGGSFSTRRVTAKQDAVILFILACSFHKNEDGYEHQIEMPANIKPPEQLMSWTDMAKQYGEMLPKFARKFLEKDRPIEVKPTDVINPFDRNDMPPTTSVWFKLKGNVQELSIPRKQEILTYISDYNILSVGLNRHASKAHWGNTIMASLDHTMHYFRDFNANDWMLYVLDTPSSQNARTLCRGHIFTREGILVATVAQEGLMRPVK